MADVTRRGFLKSAGAVAIAVSLPISSLLTEDEIKGFVETPGPYWPFKLSGAALGLVDTDGNELTCRGYRRMGPWPQGHPHNPRGLEVQFDIIPGDAEIQIGGVALWDRDGELLLEQTLDAPWHVLPSDELLTVKAGVELT